MEKESVREATLLGWRLEFGSTPPRSCKKRIYLPQREREENLERGREVDCVYWREVKGNHVWEFRPLVFYVNKSNLITPLRDWNFFLFWRLRLIFAILYFLRMLSVRWKIFTHAEYALKNVLRILRNLQMGSKETTRNFYFWSSACSACINSKFSNFEIMTKTKQFRIVITVPKSPTHRGFNGIKITRIHLIENLTLGHL